MGDGDFVQGVLSEMGGREKENLRILPHKKDLSSLATKVCEHYGITLDEMRSGSRRHEVVKARGEMSQVAVQLFGFSGAEVARYLGVTNSCITRAVSSKKIANDLRIRYGE